MVTLADDYSRYSIKERYTHPALPGQIFSTRSACRDAVRDKMIEDIVVILSDPAHVQMYNDEGQLIILDADPDLYSVESRAHFIHIKTEMGRDAVSLWFDDEEVSYNDLTLNDNNELHLFWDDSEGMWNDFTPALERFRTGATVFGFKLD